MIYHWRKAKPEKFKHSLTQVVLEEAYLKHPFEAIKIKLSNSFIE
jgi:hypothetical protein